MGIATYLGDTTLVLGLTKDKKRNPERKAAERRRKRLDIFGINCTILTDPHFKLHMHFNDKVQ